MQNQTQEQIAKLNYSAANIPKGYYTSLTAIKNQTEDRTIKFMDDFNFEEIKHRSDSGTYFEAETQWSAWLTWKEIIKNDYPELQVVNFREDEFSDFWKDFKNCYIDEVTRMTY